MATKDDLARLETRVVALQETVGMVQGQVSSMETDIKTIKGDVKDLHKRIDRVEDTSVSHAEFNDRLRPIEEKIGIGAS